MTSNNKIGEREKKCISQFIFLRESVRVSVTNPASFYLKRPLPGRIINTCISQ
jgi:hypothetical protein